VSTVTEGNGESRMCATDAVVDVLQICDEKSSEKMCKVSCDVYRALNQLHRPSRLQPDAMQAVRLTPEVLRGVDRWQTPSGADPVIAR